MNSLVVNRPLRLQADLTPPPGLKDSIGTEGYWFAGEDAAKGIRAVSGSSLFFLQLGYPPREKEYQDLFLEFIRVSAARGIRVSLVLADNNIQFTSLVDAGASELILDITASSDDEKKPGEVLEEFSRKVNAMSNGTTKTGVLFRLEKKNLYSLSGFLKACGNSGVDFIELPPQPLVYYQPREAALAVLDPGDYRVVREILKETTASLSKVKDVRVHDVLIWAMWESIRSIKEKGDSRFQGCQAAGALCYVNPKGVVYPCSVIRKPLGMVHELGENDFWQKPAVLAARREIASIVESCRACGAFEECRGGCPGVSIASGESPGEEDPLCRLFKEQIAGG